MLFPTRGCPWGFGSQVPGLAFKTRNLMDTFDLGLSDGVCFSGHLWFDFCWGFREFSYLFADFLLGYAHRLAACDRLAVSKYFVANLPFGIGLAVQILLYLFFDLLFGFADRFAHWHRLEVPQLSVSNLQFDFGFAV